MLKKYYDFILMLIAGSIAIFAFSPFNYKIVIIFTVFLLLHVLSNLNKNIKNWRLLLLGYAFGMAYFNTQLYWIYYSIHYIIHAKVIVAVVAQIGFTLFLASYIAFAIFFFNKLKLKNEFFNLVFLFPSIWVVFDWFRGWFLGGFSWCDIGYSVVDIPFFRGVFPILGEYGVSWCVISILATFYYILRVYFFKKDNLSVIKADLRIALVYLLVIFFAITIVEPITYTKQYGKPVKISLLQGNIPADVKWTDNSNLMIYQNMIKASKADIIIMPETSIPKFADDLPDGYLDSIIHDAKQNGADLIVGMPKAIDDQDNYVNAAVLLTKPEQPYYAKYHLVPYGEYIPAKWLLGPLYKYVSLPMVDFSPGAMVQKPFVAANEKLAFNICYENGFNSELIDSVRDSTVMVNLSDMVWYGKTIAMYQHLLLSQARAIENQRYFIQDTNTSITAIINPYGQIQAQLPVFTRGTLTDYITGRFGETPFEIYGNWLIISICFLLLLPSIFIKFLRNRIGKLK